MRLLLSMVAMMGCCALAGPASAASCQPGEYATITATIASVSQSGKVWVIHLNRDQKGTCLLGSIEFENTPIPKSCHAQGKVTASGKVETVDFIFELVGLVDPERVSCE